MGDEVSIRRTKGCSARARACFNATFVGSEIDFSRARSQAKKNGRSRYGRGSRRGPNHRTCAGTGPIRSVRQGEIPDDALGSLLRALDSLWPLTNREGGHAQEIRTSRRAHHSRGGTTAALPGRSLGARPRNNGQSDGLPQPDGPTGGPPRTPVSGTQHTVRSRKEGHDSVSEDSTGRETLSSARRAEE